MAKKPKFEIEVGTYDITSATIKDDFCNYQFEITEGTGLGDIHTVKGKGIIDEDLRDAFARLNVHLACVDDIFKHKGVDVKNIDNAHSHELTQLFFVTGFRMKGESVILVGNKYVTSANDRLDLTTPRIPMDSLSSYQWYNELKEAVTAVRKEVEAYKEGKYTPVEAKQKTDPNQLSIGDAIDEAAFDEARV